MPSLASDPDEDRGPESMSEGNLILNLMLVKCYKSQVTDLITMQVVWKKIY